MANTGRTHFKKGIHYSLKTEFKKGHIPWIKGKKGCHPKNGFKKGMTPWNKGLLNPITAERNKMGNNPFKKCGEEHPRWKGGVTSKDRLKRIKFRHSIQKKVFERDDYTCQVCGIRGKDMTVDHIQPWAEYVELRFCIDNCRTLCAKCHYKITFGKPMPPTVRAWGHNLPKGGTIL